MKKKLLALIALVLALLMLAGCGGDMDLNLMRLEMYYRGLDLVKYEDMKYTRPDMTEHDRVLLESCETARTAKNLEEVVEAIYAYYDCYDVFYTSYSLANIRYSANLTDIYWEEEYNYCASYTATVDAGLDALYHALADSPVRKELEGEEYFGPGFFDAYDGESIWDETFTAMVEEETALVSRYYDLSSQALEVPEGSREFYDRYGDQMAQLYAELVLLRQEMAAYLGYPGYSEFAYEFYYYRDYTPQQVVTYLDKIRQELVPMYRTLDRSVWEAGYAACDTADAMDYLQGTATAMGGVVESAFGMLTDYELYDIGYSENKYNASFETFLSSYSEPFIFMNPQGAAMDKLTLVHEFGHFANDYACLGSVAGIDVAEIFSQALEYLSLVYNPEGQTLTRYKMADSLCVFVEQAAYASFEHQVYALAPEQVTPETIRSIFAQVGEDFGFVEWGFDDRSYVRVPHFFTSPQYVISYVVSNDAAFRIYQMELAEPGAGLALYQDSLYSMESFFLAFLNSVGLESPFAEGRVETIRQTLEEMLK